MKRIILGMVIALASTQSASAFDLQSPKGIKQDQWNQTSEYLNFKCPANTARGEGVDMNFTTDRADDFYFVTCTPIQIPTKIEIIETSTAITIIPTQPVMPVPQDPVFVAPVDTRTVIVETPTAITESTTVVIDYATFDWEDIDWETFDWEGFIAWFQEWFYQIMYGVRP